MIDQKEYSEKPNDAGRLTYSIMEHPVDLYNIKQLADEIEKGKTFVPSFLKGGSKRQKKHWQHQQIVALDFDNTDEEGNRQVTFTISQALEDDFIKNNAAFLYKTFSYKDHWEKFRVVFCLDKPIHKYEKAESVTKELLKKYWQADPACKDGSRLFYGGKEVIEINYDNKLEGESFSRTKSTKSICPAKTSKFNHNIKHNLDDSNVSHIKSKNIEELHMKMQPDPIQLHNKYQVYEYLKKQDLHSYLGIYKRNFHDIFHEENSPSASIYISQNGTGHYLYKCHSVSSSFVGTIIEITERLLDVRATEAVKFLMKLYKIEIIETSTQKRLKEEIDHYKYILQSDDLKAMYPYFYKLFKGSGLLDNLYILLDLIKENLPAQDDDPRLLFFHSLNTIASKFNKSKSVTGVRMNIFTFFRLIYKLDEEEVPQDLLEIQQKVKENNQYQYLNNTYEIKLYSYNFFSELNKQCQEWIEKGLTTKAMNYEGIYRNFGRDEANRVFPQDKGKEIKPLNEKVTSLIEKSALDIIEYKGWATEKEILENVLTYFKGQKQFKSNQFKRCLGEMLEKYDLKLIRLNKKKKKELEITENDIPTKSYPKVLTTIH